MSGTGRGHVSAVDGGDDDGLNAGRRLELIATAVLGDFGRRARARPHARAATFTMILGQRAPYSRTAEEQNPTRVKPYGMEPLSPHARFPAYRPSLALSFTIWF